MLPFREGAFPFLCQNGQNLQTLEGVFQGRLGPTFRCTCLRTGFSWLPLGQVRSWWALSPDEASVRVWIGTPAPQGPVQPRVSSQKVRGDLSARLAPSQRGRRSCTATLPGALASKDACPCQACGVPGALAVYPGVFQRAMRITAGSSFSWA